MTFEQALDLLDAWAGRHASAVVRITSEEGPAPVAVFRGRLGTVERERAEAANAFLPLRLGESRDWPFGVRLEPREFEEALVNEGRLYLRLEDAIVEVATV